MRQGMRQENSQRPREMTGTGGPQGQGGPGGGRKWSRANRGIVWVKQGELILPVRVQTGITDGSVTEVTGNLKDGDELITGIVSTDPSKAGTQQQNPFAPQMPRPGGSSGRGGR